eukprot:7725132-Alexandrium_andersonii.AAC.1
MRHSADVMTDCLWTECCMLSACCKVAVPSLCAVSTRLGGHQHLAERARARELLPGLNSRSNRQPPSAQIQNPLFG